MPKVSIIIPNYNHEQFLHYRIDSVLNQTFQDFEVIILDDCSTDNSREIIELYSKHSKVTHIEYNEINSGSTFKQWEKGIELSKGEWIWIAESDDYADVFFLEKLINKINLGVGLIYCLSQVVDEIGNNTVLYNFSKMPESKLYPEFDLDFEFRGEVFIEKYMIKNNFIPNASGVLFKKSQIDSNIFNLISDKKLLGDWLFWIDILKKTNVYFVSESLNYFRTHNNTVRTISEKNNIQFKEYFSIIDYFKLDENKKKKAIDRLIFLYFESDNISFFDKWKFLSFLFKNKSFIKYLKSWILFTKNNNNYL